MQQKRYTTTELKPSVICITYPDKSWTLYQHGWGHTSWDTSRKPRTSHGTFRWTPARRWHQGHQEKNLKAPRSSPRASIKSKILLQMWLCFSLLFFLCSLCTKHKKRSPAIIDICSFTYPMLVSVASFLFTNYFHMFVCFTLILCV